MTRHVMLSFLQNLTGSKRNAKCDKIIDEKPISVINNKSNSKLKNNKKTAKAFKGSRCASLFKTKSFLRKSR